MVRERIYIQKTTGLFLLEWSSYDDRPSYKTMLLVILTIQLYSAVLCLQIITNILIIFGLTPPSHENSKPYSAVKPVPNAEVDNDLPHITSNFWLGERAYYATHNIGYTARPPHSSNPDSSVPDDSRRLAARKTRRGPRETHQSTGECVEDRAMQLAIDEIYVENGIKWESWAALDHPHR
ncbi:hypothetical protein BT96DRAFT_951256 [Gymnopus androsaceus JB14]|uniref:Uncharacterized protein n=1 Tax=Gymnopus androsaceus JB14 TaxID=1447944 RepID=A0A6A4GD97_9AGAR|nr:hypothetical protein BT96DRAFT_951256 [Gymnopus androsaceus JB14]